MELTQKEVDTLIDINVNAERLARDAYATAFTRSEQMMGWVKERAIQLLDSLKEFTGETSTEEEDGSVTKTITYAGKTYKITFPKIEK